MRAPVISAANAAARLTGSSASSRSSTRSFGRDRLVPLGCLPASHQQDALTTLLIGIGAHPFTQLARRQPLERLERLGQFAGQHDLPLGAQRVAQCFQTFQQTMRRLIKDERARLLAQRLQRARRPAGWQEGSPRR